MCKIMVAERDEIICLLYEIELSEAGYDVVTVTRAEDLMQSVASHRPELLISCGQMLMEGDLCRGLAALRRSGRSFPVILCTDGLPVADALGSLADRVVVKNRDLRRLKWTIHELVNPGPEDIHFGAPLSRKEA